VAWREKIESIARHGKNWVTLSASHHHLLSHSYERKMSRVFCIPGIIFLTCALILSVLVSISLPFLPALDFVRVHFDGGVAPSGEEMTQLRVRPFSASFLDATLTINA
jgi:hypothetical protein